MIESFAQESFPSFRLAQLLEFCSCLFGHVATVAGTAFKV